MPLSKGFLTRKSIVSKQQIISGIFIWFIFAYILYQFLNLMREVLRSLTGFLGYTKQHPLLLSAEDNFYYNLFFAPLASSIAFMWTVNHILRQSEWRDNLKNNRYLRRAINETGFVSWSALFWFAKVGGTFGIFNLSYTFQEDIDFLQDYPLFLILLPIVLLLSTWPQLIKVFGNYSIKNLVSIVAIFSGMSFLFSLQNIDSALKINELMNKHSIIYQYKLDVPKTMSHGQTLDNFGPLFGDLYLVKDTIEGNPPLIFYDEIHNQVSSFQELAWEIFINKEKLDEVERDKYFIALHVDKEVSINFVDDLIYNLRKTHHNKIQFSTGVKFSKYPSTYVYFKGLGIPIPFRPYYYPEFESFLDSAEKLDLTKYAIKLDNSWMYRGFTKKGREKTIVMEIHKEKILLNGRLFTEPKVADLIYRFLAKYPQKGLIVIEKQPDIKFDRYLACLDIIHTQLNKLRNEYSIKHFNTPYAELYSDRRAVKQAHPNQIIAWSKEEKRLIRLIQKQKRVQKENN